MAPAFAPALAGWLPRFVGGGLGYSVPGDLNGNEIITEAQIAGPPSSTINTNKPAHVGMSGLHICALRYIKRRFTANAVLAAVREICNSIYFFSAANDHAKKRIQGIALVMLDGY